VMGIRDAVVGGRPEGRRIGTCRPFEGGVVFTVQGREHHLHRDRERAKRRRNSAQSS